MLSMGMILNQELALTSQRYYRHDRKYDYKLIVAPDDPQSIYLRAFVRLINGHNFEITIMLSPTTKAKPTNTLKAVVSG
jgi:hypothetical protein